MTFDTGEYHNRFTPTHSTKYCDAKAKADHNRNHNNAAAGPSHDPQLTPQLEAVRQLGRVASSGAVQKPAAPQGKGKGRGRGKGKGAFAQLQEQLAALQAEKATWKNLPLRQLPSRDDEGRPDGGSSGAIPPI